MKIKVQKIDPAAKLPVVAYNGDAGMDIFSNEDCLINPMEKAVIGTGLKFEIPAKYAGFIWDKSGLAVNNSLKTMAGVLDSGYRGELKIVLINLGKEPYKVEKGKKIAQMIISRVERPNIAEAVLKDTQRNQKGFGSSGLK
jgi:dUTP pyrophosphatase